MALSQANVPVNTLGTEIEKIVCSVSRIKNLVGIPSQESTTEGILPQSKSKVAVYQERLQSISSMLEEIEGILLVL